MGLCSTNGRKSCETIYNDWSSCRSSTGQMRRNLHIMFTRALQILNDLMSIFRYVFIQNYSYKLIFPM